MKTQILDTRINCMFPWFNKTAIEYITKINISTWNVFEWGSGYSTIWWSHYAKHITAIEHYSKWFQTMRNLFRPVKRSNIICKLKDFKKSVSCPYTKAIHDTPDIYDCIIVDGRNRVLCIQEIFAQKHTKPGSLIILDNSDRGRYAEGIKILNRHGLIVLKTPVIKGNLYRMWETTIWKIA